MSLATYSQELKIFNVEDDYSSPVNVCVSSKNATHGRITWSGDGKWLAVAPFNQGSDPLPIFKYSNHQLQPIKYITLTNITSASFFNWTNRNIGIGNKNGELFVWDLMAKKISVKVEYVENQSVDLISVNSDDTYIASGSLDTNKICVHGLKTNKVVNTICVPQSKQTSSLKFCLCKKNYLGASSVESTVCVWDISASEFIFKSCHAHTGACTDISFSPINYHMIASVSLTKTMKIHDIRERKSILDVSLGEPLNCVDIILNGDKVALGSTGGSVIIYDLRANKVLNTFKADNGPILSVKTQNLKIPKSYKEVEMNTPDTLENQSRTFDISVMDAFSPINKNFNNDLLNSFTNHSICGPPQSTPNVAVTESSSTLNQSPYDDSFLKKVLSPLPSQKSLCTLPNSQSSPYLHPIIEKADSGSTQMQNQTNTPVKKELPTVNGIGEGDCFETDNTKERNLYYSDIVSEIRACREVVLNEISCLKKEVYDIKSDFEKKFKVLNDGYEFLSKLITDGIQQGIETGNCNSKIQHSVQRILINELNESFLAAEVKIREEIKLNALRLMHIYDVVKSTK